MIGKCKQLEIKNITKWVENIFRRSWVTYRIDDIIKDFSKGVIIIHLVKALAQRKLPVLYPMPKAKEQNIGNIEIALQTFKEDGVECPGIFANDIANEDRDIIIAFCYMLKYHYSHEYRSPTSATLYHHRYLPTALNEKDSYGKEDRNDSSHEEDERSKNPMNFTHFVPFEKEDIAVFEWVSTQIGIQIHDYNVFNDGILLCKLINKISFRKIPDKVIANSAKSERVKLALRFAAHELGIEIKLEPSDVIEGKNRKVLRRYIYILKTIKSKQDQLLMTQLKGLEGYSDFVDSIGFSNKGAKHPSPTILSTPLHDDLCTNISASALCDKLNHSASAEPSFTSLKDIYVQTKGCQSVSGGPRTAASNDSLKDENSRGQNSTHERKRSIRYAAMRDKLNAMNQSMSQLKAKCYP